MKGDKSVKACVYPLLMVLVLRNVAASLDLEGADTSLVPKSPTAEVRQSEVWVRDTADTCTELMSTLNGRLKPRFMISWFAIIWSLQT